MPTDQSLYGRGYHSQRDERTRYAAQLITGLLMKHVAPASCVEVGCGVGTWLRVLKDGGTVVRGYDGPWVDARDLVIDADEFEATDLRTMPNDPGYYDLALCLEVAEHLPISVAPALVEWLCSHSPVVLFSAAIPGQRGRGHLNEQWQNWWADRFRAHEFVPLDLIRPLIWYDERVPHWYRQNVLVYTRPGTLRTEEGTVPALLDVVHPEQWRRERSRSSDMGIRRSARQLLRSIHRTLIRAGRSPRKRPEG
jgi:SAM-dependent methyltransferase